jgi:hypothetical protein
MVGVFFVLKLIFFGFSFRFRSFELIIRRWRLKSHKYAKIDIYRIHEAYRMGEMMDEKTLCY